MRKKRCPAPCFGRHDRAGQLPCTYHPALGTHRSLQLVRDQERMPNVVKSQIDALHSKVEHICGCSAARDWG